MKITKRQLRRIIREEKQKLNEAMSMSMLTKQQITEVLFQQFAMHMLGQTDFADDGSFNSFAEEVARMLGAETIDVEMALSDITDIPSAYDEMRRDNESRGIKNKPQRY